MSFQQGLSGLGAASQNLDTIGNNVANSSTYGYKEARAQFGDLFASSLATGLGTQIGIGTKLEAVQQQYTQGNITTTGNPMDVAINGNGFFRLSNGGSISYTRNGQFSLDKNGFIVTDTGANLTGYPASAAGVVTPTTPVPLQISTADLTPNATTKASMSLNLDSTMKLPTTTPFSATDPTTYNSSTAMSIYDSQGNAHTLTTYFVRTGNGATPPVATNTWTAYAAIDGNLVTSGAPATAVTASLPFSASGLLSADVTMNLPITLANGATINGGNALPVTFPMASMSQYGVAFSVNQLTQDGYTTGQLSGYTIGNDGTILGRYSNGQSRALGQIATANFMNPQGLTDLGNNQLGESSTSGQPTTGAPGAGVLGSLQSGALEDSNVDLTSELVSMITAQRDYQANAQTIKTEDQVMQTLVNLR